MESNDFFKELDQFRSLEKNLETIATEGEAKLNASHAKIKQDFLDSLQASSNWMNLDELREQINQDIEAISVDTTNDLVGLTERVSHEYDLNTRLREIRDEAEKLAKEKAKAKEGSKVHMPVPHRFDTPEQIDELVKRLESVKDELPADIDWKF